MTYFQQRLYKKIADYKEHILGRSHDHFAAIAQQLIEFEINEIQSLNQMSEWASELDGLVRNYQTKREDIKNCFKVLNLAANKNARLLERDFMEKLAVFQQNLEKNVGDQLESIHLASGDQMEVEHLVWLNFDTHVISPQDASFTGPLRQRKRSMLPVKNKNDQFINPRKSADILPGQLSVAYRSDRPSPARNANPRGGPNNSKSPGPKGGFASINNPTNFFVTDGINQQRFLNQSREFGQQGLDYPANDPSFADISGYAEATQKYAHEQAQRYASYQERTPTKGDLRFNPDRSAFSPIDVSKRQTINDEEVDLLSSGLFDNGGGLRNTKKVLRPKKSQPDISLQDINPASQGGSFYHTEQKGSSKIVTASFREQASSGRYMTPNKTSSKLDPNKERTADQKKSFQGALDAPRSSTNIQNAQQNTSFTNNRVTTTTSTVNRNKSKTPEKAKPKTIFDQEPVKSLMKSLDADTLPALILKSHQLTDADVTEICNRISFKNNLKIIDLSSNNITDAGLKMLCEKLLTTSVETLLMRFNKITNEGLKVCFTMVRDPSNKVRMIAIDPCKIEKTDEGRKQIIEAFMKKRVVLQF